MAFDILNVPENVPKTKISQYITFMFAPPKFGKSTFASLFGNVLFLAFEPGYGVLRCRPVDIPDWKWFVKNVVDPLEKAYLEGKTIPYDTIAIDTVDKASAMCKDFVCRREGIAHESDLDWGKGYAYIKEEYDKQMLRLSKLGCGVIFISHSEAKTFKPKGKEEYVKIIPSIPKGAREVLLPMCDMILFGDLKVITDEDGNQKEVRVLNCRETVEFEAGCRLKYMPSQIDFGTSEDEGYTNFMNAFNEAVGKQFGGKKEAPKRTKTEPPKAEVSKESPKEEPKVESPKQEKVKKEKVKVEHTVVDKPEEPAPSEEENLSLDDVKQEINALFMELYKSGAKSPVELVEMVKTHTGQERVSSIKELDGAVKLLKALKE